MKRGLIFFAVFILTLASAHMALADKIEVLSWSCKKITRFGTRYVRTIGEIKNNTGRTITAVKIKINFYDKGGTFLGYDFELIFEKIQPGGTATFQTRKSGDYIDQIENCKLQIQYRH
jgi:hypothetical protein